MSAGREATNGQESYCIHTKPEGLLKYAGFDPKTISSVNELVESTSSCQTCESCSRGSECTETSKCSRDLTCDRTTIHETPSFHPSYALLQTFGYKAPDSDDSEEEELENIFNFNGDDGGHIKKYTDSEETLKGNSHEDLVNPNTNKGRVCRCGKQLAPVNQ